MEKKSFYNKTRVYVLNVPALLFALILEEAFVVYAKVRTLKM